LYLYLKVDGLVSNALNAHVDPIFVQPALERTDGWRHHNLLRKLVPICDYSVAQWVFPNKRRHLETASFRLWSQRPWPLVESWKNWFLSKFSRSVIILNASIRSPLRLVVSKVVRPSWLSLSSYLRVFRWGTIFVAARWTFSRIWISFGRWGDHAEHSTPCVVRAWVSYSTFYRFGRLSR